MNLEAFKLERLLQLLESEIKDMKSELNRAQLELKRANALTETQARIIRRLVDENLEESE